MKMHKLKIASFLTAAVMTVSLLPMTVSAAETAANDDYEIRVATFEGSEWDELIDTPQYGGPLLYGSEGMGSDTPYEWYDADTGLYFAMKAANSYGPLLLLELWRGNFQLCFRRN